MNTFEGLLAEDLIGECEDIRAHAEEVTGNQLGDAALLTWMIIKLHDTLFS